MAWWRDAKFGMLVHWGLYAEAEGRWNGTSYPNTRPGFEWLMYKGRVDKDEYVKTLAPRMMVSRGGNFLLTMEPRADGSW